VTAAKMKEALAMEAVQVALVAALAQAAPAVAAVDSVVEGAAVNKED